MMIKSKIVKSCSIALIMHLVGSCNSSSDFLFVLQINDQINKKYPKNPKFSSHPPHKMSEHHRTITAGAIIISP